MKQDTQVEQIKLDEVAPGDVIELTPELKKMIQSSYHVEKVPDEAMFMGTAFAYAKGMVIPRLYLNKAEVLGLSAALSFDPKSPLNVIRDKRHEEVRDTFKMRYKTSFPTFTHVGMHIGGDPELFVMKGNGDVLPAWEFLRAKSMKDDMYWDGVQAEFRASPRTCLVEYTNNLQFNLGNLMQAAVKKDRHAQMSRFSVVPVPEVILKNSALKYLEFGCQPSISVYEELGEPSIDPRLLPVRFAGGHIHAGIGEQVYGPKIREAVYALDGILGVAAVGMAANMDDPQRRRFYGRAGEIRLPKHGLEYRVLSNFWLISPPIAYMVHELFRAALRFGLSGAYSLLFKTPQVEVRRIINELDVKAARKSVKDNEKLYEFLCQNMNVENSPRNFKYLKRAIYGGVEAVLPNMDINVNWTPKGIKDVVNAGIAPYSEAGRGGDLTWAMLCNKLELKRVQPVGVYKDA